MSFQPQGSETMTKSASSKLALIRVFTVAMLAVIGSAMTTPASAYTDRVQNNCKGDYLTFCSAHAIGSTGMRQCMEANGKNLSPKCVSALVDAGQIPKKYVKK
jgi:hypothetical protein